MNKAEERRHFDQAYGPSNGWSLSETESPDFLLTCDGQVILGVEVTELFANQSDARLRKIDGYFSSLLDGGPHRTRSDRKNLRVTKLTITDKEGNNPRAVDGIVINQPTFESRVRLLESVVADKESLLAAYLNKAPIVDLLIADSTSLFRFDKFREIFTPLSLLVSRSTVINSGFREITVLTTCGPKGRSIRIPLKLNLFAEDLLILEQLLLRDENLSDESGIADSFSLLSACLAHIGYSNCVAITDGDSPGFVIGSHVYLYGAESKNIRDYTNVPHHLPTGVRLEEALASLTSSAAQRVVELCTERKKWKGVVELFFPAHDT